MSYFTFFGVLEFFKELTPGLNIMKIVCASTPFLIASKLNQMIHKVAQN